MLALAIFIITLVFVIWQPKGLGIGWSALAGAGIALATGVIHLQDTPIVWHIVWDATFTFIALIVISLLLDKAGFFQWAALHVARWGKGRGGILFPLIIVLGAAIAAVFANDGAALLLTPIVIALLAQLRLPQAASLAIIIATGFVADTTSLPLVISNLVNIVSANFFGISFNRYAAVMIPVDLVALAGTLTVLWGYYRREIPGTYGITALPEPASAIQDRQVFKAAFPLLAALLMAYFVTAPFHIPVCIVACVAAAILLAIALRVASGGRGRVIAVGEVLKGAPWQIVLFSLGMYLIVYGLRNAGLTEYVADVLVWLGHHGPWAAAVGTGFLTAILSSIMNNMPSVLIGALSIQQAHDIAPVTRDIMIYANIIGCDLGPKFTPIGSLATLLWLHVLAARNYKITWLHYMRVGLLITPPVLLITLTMLAFWLPLIGTG